MGCSSLPLVQWVQIANPSNNGQYHHLGINILLVCIPNTDLSRGVHQQFNYLTWRILSTHLPTDNDPIKE